MRLTLRTMLAYMDDILDPADAEELASKIKESEFASRLVHRIRSSMRHLRVGAPKLDGKGMALDPNTVAEYLDNALPHERFPDFEKVCLESDVHLAEVAACHQILTLVLGEPADVPDAIRDRVYSLGGGGAAAAATSTTLESADGSQLRVDRKHQHTAAMEPPVTAAAGSGAAAAPGNGSVTPAKQSVSPAADVEEERITEVPEYMKVAQRKPVWLYLVGAAALVLVAVLGYQVVFNSGPVVAVNEGGEEQQPENNPENTEPPEQPVVETDPVNVNLPEEPVPVVPPADPNVGPVVEPGVPTIPETGPSVHPTEIDGPGENPIAPPPNEIPETGGNTTLPIEAVPNENSANPQPINPGPANPAVPTNPGNGNPVIPAPGDPNAVGPNEIARIDVPAAPEAVMDVGKNASSDNQILTRWNAQEEAWLRVPPRAMLSSTDRLAVLPMYQPQLMLLSGVRLQFSGASMARLLPIDAQGVSGVAMESGRVLLDTGNADRIRLQLGSRSGVLIFGDVKSVAAIEVKKYLPPGEDARTKDAMDVVMIYASNGSVQWQETGGDAVATINSGELHFAVADQPSQTISYGAGPKWITGQEASQIEKRAASELEPHLSLERSISLSLKERAMDTKIEVRSLAARSLAHLGELNGLIKELSDPNQHSFWPQDFKTLREVVLLRPENAKRIFSLLERTDAERGEELYKLVTGFSEQELGTGGAERLVDLLESDHLIERVLAIENLKQICEMDLFYSAWRPEAMRRSKVQRWRERLEGGLIVYKRPPSPIPPVPLAAPASGTAQPSGDVLP